MKTSEHRPDSIHDSIFPKGEPISNDYFTGKVWLNPLVPNDTIFNSQIGSVTFEAGARNNWHFHPGGQILIITAGIGYYQERGKPIQLMRKGDVIKVPPGVEHWHGAAADREMTHIAISTNAEKGIVTWLESVTDQMYNGYEK
jgi:quercetin dioxygenase-like cupin family protein